MLHHFSFFSLLLKWACPTPAFVRTGSSSTPKIGSPFHHSAPSATLSLICTGEFSIYHHCFAS